MENREVFLGVEQTSNPSYGFPSSFRKQEPPVVLALGSSGHESPLIKQPLLLWRLILQEKTALSLLGLAVYLL